MKGSKRVRITSRRCTYRFELRRNITILAGDSGTGKTTLYELVADHTRSGENSGVIIECPDARGCVALVDTDWRNQLGQTHESIVFVDEGFSPITSKEFAEAIAASDNYYVLITRSNLYQLSYSVDEIYRIKTSGKRMHQLVPVHPNRGGHRYYLTPQRRQAERYDVVLVEDSQAGFEFYRARLEDAGIACETANGCAGIFHWLEEHPDCNVFVVADGAAFGAEANRVLKLQDQNARRVTICLPESFEWLVLMSRLVHDDELEQVLSDPGARIESSEYLSWERFFTDYLVRISQGTAFQYQKGALADAYRVDVNAERIIAEIAHGNVR